MGDKKDTRSDVDATEKEQYFVDYASHTFHEEMLKDDVRMLAYRDAMWENKHLFEGKVVLDVGCGTGIMSFFAAKAGAKKVIGIECSDMAIRAQKIVKKNNLDDVVTIIQARVEDVVLPDGIKKVDMIVSEWMGYALYVESMLPCVLYARDKWLKPEGSLWPDVGALYICGVEDKKWKDDKINYWDDIYGFDFSTIRSDALYEPHVRTVEPEKVVTKACLIHNVDLATVKMEDLTFTVPFNLECKRNDSIHSLAVYFIMEFSKTNKKSLLSTAPEEPYTHWKQTVFYLDQVMNVSKGEVVKGTLAIKSNEHNWRDLDWKIKVDFDGQFSQLHKSSQYCTPAMLVPK